MIKKLQKYKNGFSLIEMSVVILIIGILIMGTMQAQNFIDKYKIANARSQTKNSIVAEISDLAAWYETTSEESFDATEADNDLYIQTWYDINQASTSKHHASSLNPNTTSPVYTANCINGLPCLRFNGTFSYLSLGLEGGNFLVNTDYTIFVVEQRKSNADGFFFGSSSASLSSNDRITLGYQANPPMIIFSQNNNDSGATIDGYSAPIPKIHTFRFDTSLQPEESHNYRLNAAALSLTDIRNSSNTQISSNSFAAIGYNLGLNYSGYFNGDIAEIIIYTKALNTDEINSVEKYLSKKWGIAI